MSFSFYFYTNDDVFDQLEVNSFFGNIYDGLRFDQGTHELDWDTIYRLYTCFSILHYLRPLQHELYPSQDPDDGMSEDGYWYLRIDNEEDDDGNPVEVDPEVRKADIETLAKIQHVISEYLFNGYGCSINNYTDENGLTSVYWFDMVRQVKKWFEDVINKKAEDPKLKVFYYKD